MPTAHGYATRDEEQVEPAQAFGLRDQPFLIDHAIDPTLLAPMSQWEVGVVPLSFA